MGKNPEPVRTCLECGKPLAGKQTKFCSGRHRYNHWAKTPAGRETKRKTRLASLAHHRERERARSKTLYYRRKARGQCAKCGRVNPDAAITSTCSSCTEIANRRQIWC